MRRESIARILSVLFLLAATQAVPACAEEVVLQDGTFNPENWSVTLCWLEGLGGNADAYQVQTGGNPGQFRATDIWLIRGEDLRYNAVCLFHSYLPQVISPVQEGGILWVDYSEDSRLLVGYNQGQGGGPAIRQDGVIFRSDSFAIPQTYWMNHAFTGLTQDDFYDPENPTHHPDFSASGTPIEFGFFRGNSGTSNDPYHSQAGIDNWHFTIHTAMSTPVRQTTWGAVKALFSPVYP